MSRPPISLTGFLLLSAVLHGMGLGLGSRWLSSPPAYDIDRTLPPMITVDLTEFERPEPIAEAEVEEPFEPEPEPEPEPIEETDQAEAILEEPFKEPLYLRNPPPAYPQLARRQGWEGVTLLRVEINLRGRVDQVALVQSSGYTLLDEAAIQAVRRWQFAPARFAGQPVSATVEIPIRFELR